MLSACRLCQTLGFVSISSWILLFIGNCAFCYWVLRLGGSEWMEGWRSAFVLDWLPSFLWTSEQIKLYVLLCWVGHAAWFAIGLFLPGLRL